MADARLQVLITARDQTAQAMSSSLRRLEAMKGQLRTTGLILGGFAAVGTAAFGSIIASAFAQEQSVSQLDQALKNIGLSYEELKGPIEGTIAALQAKTNFADEPQRAALRRLIEATGDFQLSLEALPVVLDVAAASDKDLEQTALAVGRALQGDVEALSRYGLNLAEGRKETDKLIPPTEVLGALMVRFGGQAEAAANPVIQLRNSLGDTGEIMGTSLIPAVTAVTGILAAFSKALQGMDPRVLRVILIIGAVAVAFAAVAGPVLLLLALLPALAAGFALFAAAGGTIIVVVSAIVTAIVAAVIIWRAWRPLVDAVRFAFDVARDSLKKFWAILTDTFTIERLLSLLSLLNDKLFAVRAALGNMFAGVAGGLKGALNAVIGGLNHAFRVAGHLIELVKEALDALPGSNPAGDLLLSIASRLQRGIPELQAGGIVTKPTLAFLGERGPEAVIPLGHMAGVGGSVVINIHNPTIFGEMDLERVIVRAVRNHALGGGFHGVLAKA